MEALTKDPENSDKGKNNAHHNKADGCKQQLVVKLSLSTDSGAQPTQMPPTVDGGLMTTPFVPTMTPQVLTTLIMTPQTELRSLMRRTFRSSIQNAHLHGVVQR